MVAHAYIHGSRGNVGIRYVCFVGKFTNKLIIYFIYSSWRIMKFCHWLVWFILWWWEILKVHIIRNICLFKLRAFDCFQEKVKCFTQVVCFWENLWAFNYGVCNEFLFCVVGEQCLVAKNYFISWNYVILLHHEVQKKINRLRRRF